MSDILSQVTGQQDFLKTSWRRSRALAIYRALATGGCRMAIARKIADEFDTLNQRVSSLQREMVDQGELAAVGSRRTRRSNCASLPTGYELLLTAMPASLMRSRSRKSSSTRSINTITPCWNFLKAWRQLLIMWKPLSARKDRMQRSATWSPSASSVWMPLTNGPK